MSKNGVSYKADLPATQALALLENLVESLKKGKVCVQVGKEYVIMGLGKATPMEMEMSASLKKGKKQLSLKLGWSDPKYDSEQAPAIEIGTQAPAPELPQPAPAAAAKPGAATPKAAAPKKKAATPRKKTTAKKTTAAGKATASKKTATTKKPAAPKKAAKKTTTRKRSASTRAK